MLNNKEVEQTPQEQIDEIVNNTLDKTNLESITKKNLDQVTKFNLKIDTRSTNATNLGKNLLFLEHLTLSGYIPSIRDLGSSYDTLTSLTLIDVNLSELDGISSMPYLKVCVLSNNCVSDIIPLSNLENLTTLDVSFNNISDFEMIEYLCLCPILSNLNILGNPIMTDGEVLCRDIRGIMPGLKLLNENIGNRGIEIVDVIIKQPSPPKIEPSVNSRARNLRRANLVIE